MSQGFNVWLPLLRVQLQNFKTLYVREEYLAALYIIPNHDFYGQRGVWA